MKILKTYTGTKPPADYENNENFKKNKKKLSMTFKL